MELPDSFRFGYRVVRQKTMNRKTWNMSVALEMNKNIQF